MLTFHDFSKDLDINKPEEYVSILHAYEAFIDTLWKDYGGALDMVWRLSQNCSL